MVSLLTPKQMNNLELHNIADNLSNLVRPNQESTASILNRAANNIEEIRDGYRQISNMITEDRAKLQEASNSLKITEKKIDKISQEINEVIHPPIGTKKLEGDELEEWKKSNSKSFLSGLATALFAIGFFSSIVVSCFVVAVPVAVPVISFIGLVISGVMYVRNKSEMRQLYH